MENKKLHLVWFPIYTKMPDVNNGGYPSSGIIGTCTEARDVNGEMIFVGDIVKVTKSFGDWSGLVIQLEDKDWNKCYTVTGMASTSLKDLTKLYKVERVVPYTHLNQEYRRHINYISLSEKYLDTSWNFINGSWSRIHPDVSDR